MQGQDPGELFDVVDEHDRVVGRATRREVHAKRLLHRAVHVMVYDGAGRIFLQKRSRYKDTHPGAWSAACAGHVDAGEDYADTVPRELSEELGLRPGSFPAPEELFRLSPCRETGWEFIRVYRLLHEGPFTLPPAEVERGDWFTPAEIDAAVAGRPADFTPSFLLIWNRMGQDGR